MNNLVMENRIMENHIIKFQQGYTAPPEMNDYSGGEDGGVTFDFDDQSIRKAFIRKVS